MINKKIQGDQFLFIVICYMVIIIHVSIVLCGTAKFCCTHAHIILLVVKDL
jgi:hypothetical protein